MFTPPPRPVLLSCARKELPWMPLLSPRVAKQRPQVAPLYVTLPRQGYKRRLSLTKYTIPILLSSGLI
jgi:hypothetical protein